MEAHGQNVTVLVGPGRADDDRSRCLPKARTLHSVSCCSQSRNEKAKASTSHIHDGTTKQIFEPTDEPELKLDSLCVAGCGHALALDVLALCHLSYFGTFPSLILHKGHSTAVSSHLHVFKPSFLAL